MQEDEASATEKGLAMFLRFWMLALARFLCTIPEIFYFRSEAPKLSENAEQWRKRVSNERRESLPFSSANNECVDSFH